MYGGAEPAGVRWASSGAGGSTSSTGPGETNHAAAAPRHRLCGRPELNVEFGRFWGPRSGAFSAAGTGVISSTAFNSAILGVQKLSAVRVHPVHPAGPRGDTVCTRGGRYRANCPEIS